jgi:hypothetical protein
VTFDEPEDATDIGGDGGGLSDDMAEDEAGAQHKYDAAEGSMLDASEDNEFDSRAPQLGDDDDDDLDDDDEDGMATDDEEDGRGARNGDERGKSDATAAQRQDVVSLTLLSKFVREVASRLRQFKNELLSACVRLVLAVPRALVDVPLLVPALDTALRLGVGYLPLARVGLDALERWLDTRPRSVAPFLPRVLPRLQRYLMADAPEEHDVANMEAEEVKARRLAQRVARRKHTTVETGDESNPVYGLQLRVIRLLGQLGGRAAAVLGVDAATNSQVDVARNDADDADDAAAAAAAGGDGAALIAWDTEQRLDFTVQFVDTTHTIFFDPILPRILALAEGAADRRTKVFFLFRSDGINLCFFFQMFRLQHVNYYMQSYC